MNNIIMFDGPYSETMSLLEKVRHYILYEERYDRQRVGEKSAHIINYEMMDIIARLSHVLSWLIAQKAVRAGEITIEESLEPKWQLSSAIVCMNTDYEADESIPERLRHFMVQSRNLFERVGRLERQLLSSIQR
jgi:regulator of CtrA degradation